jgi:hypothetical protein
MNIEVYGPTTAEGECKQAKKLDIEPYFFVGTRSQIVQRIIVRGTAGAESKYVLRVTTNGKLALTPDVPEQKVISRFDRVNPKEDTDGSDAGS